MFLRLGQFVARYWLGILLLWITAVAGLAMIAPPLDDVVQTGEFAFLPEDSPSRVAERLLTESFPEQVQASTVAVIISRSTGELSEKDFNFIDDDQPPGTADRPLDLTDRLRGLVAAFSTPSDEATGAGAPAISVDTFRDRAFGARLIAPNRQATLILMELPREFLDSANVPMVRQIEQLLFFDPAIQQTLPPGLEIFLSGTAVVGRDMLQTARESAKATEHLTIILVIALLILIYRAPLLAFVPLITVFVAVKITMLSLCWLAARHWVVLFTGIESYVTVLVYGAGVDYCLFLIARYKEEIDRGVEPQSALVDSMNYVGAAIAASAGTVICGIGMMVFAEFGKFHDAGIAISFGLISVLLASLTLTPALLRWTGRYVFWPRLHHPTTTAAPQRNVLQSLWDSVSHRLQTGAASLWFLSVAVMLPFAVVGMWFYTDLSYGLLSDLPKSARSVVGTAALQRHFPDGVTGPITMLLRTPSLDFSAMQGDNAGLPYITQLSQELQEREDEFRLADVRSVAFPVGGDKGLADITNPAVYKLTMRRALESYVDTGAPANGSITRIELVTDDDPFSRDSMQRLGDLERQIQTEWQRITREPTTFYTVGPTASIRDLKAVTDRDQIRIDLLVVGGVFFILVLLLRQPMICVYLIVSVLFSYLATLGVTYLSFWAWEGPDFAGLDWKVPMFLFTILIAVGEDYNIFLMSRVAEEQASRGRVEGVLHALSATGKIISSCGIIMAGTFASLAAGSLKGMSQLGFALAFGVLLDTFVVRPVLVPAFLVLLEQGKLGILSRSHRAKLDASRQAAEQHASPAAPQ